MTMDEQDLTVQNLYKQNKVQQKQIQQLRTVNKRLESVLGHEKKILNQLMNKLDEVESELAALQEQLAEKRPTNKCITRHCDNFIDHDYCATCRKDWAS